MSYDHHTLAGLKLVNNVEQSCMPSKAEEASSLLRSREILGLKRYSQVTFFHLPISFVYRKYHH